MAGSLIKVDEFTISSPVASIILGGGSSGSSGLNASIDSTYDVYMVKYNNISPSTDATQLQMRVTVSGSPDTSSNYDRAAKQMKAFTSFSNSSATNENLTYPSAAQTGTGTSETNNGILYLFNFNNASEYSFGTVEVVTTDFSGARLYGFTGGFVNTVSQSCDGLQFFQNSGNIASGTFTLYGLAK